MIKMIFSPLFIRKLDRIYDFIAIDLDNSISAKRTVNKIIESLERLRNFPESAPKITALYSKIPEQFAETRFLVCGSFLVFFEKTDNTIEIIQIYHGSEDYIRHIIKPE
jgi:plasmid stabilization system protein ParE